MAYLLILTVILGLIVLLYFNIRTVRDERAELLRFLAFGSVIVLLDSYFLPRLSYPVLQLFKSSLSLCLASVTSIYIRNNLSEFRTSGYLVLLAIFPFTLFFVFFIFHTFFAHQIADGFVYDYLRFFQLQARAPLFVIALVYDLTSILPKRQKWDKLSTTIDGQLALALIAVKIIVLLLILGNGLIFGTRYLLLVPDYGYALLTLLTVFYYRNFTRIQLRIKYLLKQNALSTISDNDHAPVKLNQLRYYASVIDQLVTGQKLYLRENLQLKDLQSNFTFSISELQKAVENHLGGSWEHYLNKKRIAHFLEHIDLKVLGKMDPTRISGELGFSTRASFEAAFEEIVGCSFGKYNAQKMYPVSENKLLLLGKSKDLLN
ncbi:hypothetical protein [Sphingobacterium lactis]|uniref:HTH araC/xylS-type domain-containing protein n=1 Tax=Sphingobacterium lactis TaxID=797291 RepID=A0A1H6AHR5_9SPHI|nr:hypothetical protein [Sphingobacterium lactis]SEG47800.1 hypothetical protein SAMN05421877_108140 [Sphingobacterium lactis]